ncbi:hypothetical protein TRFO_17793 [Tritrichomonas foetus]|uniref:Uncharacterized protein n=1 Tax=Tritrichomonas foetus TaxID=1144522 RepID=A0A1J4KSG5_9EUKA|nr:hypothetical protein TRFO_17793 [Tritrichomonas foetus]|eukprot:OHT12413.1 hypothetical protein TRFO_17793 [Tritrichomonas foetus]
MILFTFLAINTHFPIHQNNLESTVCVCQSSQRINCTVACGQYKQIDYDSSSMETFLKNYDHDYLSFIIVGTSLYEDDNNYKDNKNHLPKFYLNNFRNMTVSFQSYDLQTPEHIILYNGTNNKGTNALFSNINVHFVAGGIFKFQNLELIHTNFSLNEEFIHKSKEKLKIKAKNLTSDYESISNIPKKVLLSGPTRGMTIFCSEKVKNIQILKNHQISLHETPEIVSNENLTIESKRKLDLSQIEKEFNATFVFNTRDLKITFDFVPHHKSDLPKVNFKMLKSSNVFIDANQFPDNMMYLSKLVFIHDDNFLYIKSKNEINPPVFNHIGNGNYFPNNEKRTFSTKYCICSSSIKSLNSCDSICQNNPIIGFEKKALDDTVIGNPSNDLTYLIANSGDEENCHPVFDLEHFGNRNLTVLGFTENEFVSFTGDATDDIGLFTFKNLSISGNLLFPNISLENVKVLNKLEKRRLFKSVYLTIDMKSLMSIFQTNVIFSAPQKGMTLYDNVIDSPKNDDLILSLLNPGKIQINNAMNLSLTPLTLFSLYTSKNIYFYKNKNYPPLVSGIPKIKIYFNKLNQNINKNSYTIAFPGKEWPKQLSDISAKITIVHGESSIYVIGDFDGNKYLSNPPIIDNEGTGPVFYNDILKNYENTFCICENANCEEICTNNGKIVNFTEDSIAETATNNPIRSITYNIYGTTLNRMPLFGLHTFPYKSFSIHAIGNQRQFIALEGGGKMDETVSSSVSHIFSNVDIILSNSGAYFFNNVEFTNCTVSKNQSVSGFFRVIQSGMTVDLMTLQSFTKKRSNLTNEKNKNEIDLYNDDISDIIVPSHRYLNVNGGKDLAKIIINDEFRLSLTNEAQNIHAVVEIALLKHNPVMIYTNYGFDKEHPLKIIWNANEKINTIKELPYFNIDISGVDSDNAYIHFIGRKWTGDFHNLTKKITVTHGQANLHVSAEENGKNVNPPHLSLNGIGDYFIDEVKQIYAYAPDHPFESDDDEEKNSLFGYILSFLLIAFIITIGIFVYNYRKKNNNFQLKNDYKIDEIYKMTSDLPIDSFPNVGTEEPQY